MVQSGHVPNRMVADRSVPSGCNRPRGPVPVWNDDPVRSLYNWHSRPGLPGSGVGPMTDRKKPGAAFWATVVVVVGLVGYPLSFGPACWWFSDEAFLGVTHFRLIPRFYWPIEWLMRNGPHFISSPLLWY